LLPIYRYGAPLTSPAEREAAAIGWSYAPLVIDEVLQTLGNDAALYTIALSDTLAADSTTFYRSSANGASASNSLQHQIVFDVFGRTWQADLQATPAFAYGLTQTPPRQVFAIMVMMSALFAMLAFVLAQLALRKQNERNEQARRASIVEASDDAIIAVELDGTITDWNAGAERLFGRAAREAVGRNVVDLLLTHIASTVRCGARVRPFETQRRHSSGALIDVSISAAPIMRTDGQCIGYSKTLRDFSEIKRDRLALAVLNASLETQVADRTAQLDAAMHDLRAVLDAVPSMIGYWDHALVSRMANRAYSKYFNLAHDELPGRTMRAVLGDELFERNRPLVEAVLRGEPQIFERDLPLADGTGVRHTLAHYLPDVVGGVVRGFYVLIHDVSEIVTGRIALAQLADKLQQMASLRQAILDSAEFSFISTNLEGVIQTFSLGAQRMLGYSAAEMEGKQTPAILHDVGEVVARAQALSKELNTPIEPGFDAFVAKIRILGVVDEKKWTYRRKDGSTLPIILSATAIRDGQDQITGYLGIARDISESLANERKQKAFTDKLTRVNEELSSFAYIASHDLKSPLRGIDQIASWIAEDLGDTLSGDTQKHLTLMRSRIKRMEMLLDDLLAYSRVGHSTDTLISINTRELVKDIFELQAPAKPIQLVVADDMPLVTAKKVPLELIFRNLISNAIKHHDKPQGSIWISARTISDGFEFTVRDDGPGIPPEHQKRVFGMFQTLKPRDELEGSGIGLALVKKAVESQGGSVTVESDGVFGCTFRFTWPSSFSTENI
jgi:PAS domain S-box-containing protein